MLPSEIYQKSQCYNKEVGIIFQIERELRQADFAQVTPYIWQYGNKTVVLRLVDDFTTICGERWGHMFPFGLPSGTLVITDNYITEIAQFDILRLPDSFFGIYSYIPEHKPFEPDRRFSLLTNRLDFSRVVVLLDWVTYYCKNDLDALSQLAYVTFNCAVSNHNSRKNATQSEIEFEFDSYWELLDNTTQAEFSQAYYTLRSMMPYRNFDIDFDNVATHSMLNMVIETYINDQVISLSEKTFRALVTNSPSIIYGSRYHSVWLKKLGFKLLDQYLDLSYESFYEKSTVNSASRAINFSTCAQASYDKLCQDHIKTVSEQVYASAQHNIEVLQQYADVWDSEFDDWKQQLRTKLIKLKQQ